MLRSVLWLQNVQYLGVLSLCLFKVLPVLWTSFCVCVEEEDVDLTDMTHGRCEHPHTSV